jgi:hypothetical protein
MFRGIEFLEKDLQQPLDFSSLNHVLRGSIQKFRRKKITSSNNPRYISQSHLNRDLVAAWISDCLWLHWFQQYGGGGAKAGDSGGPVLASGVQAQYGGGAS